jgi:hypothetical protein
MLGAFHEGEAYPPASANHTPPLSLILLSTPVLCVPSPTNVIPVVRCCTPSIVHPQKAQCTAAHNALPKGLLVCCSNDSVHVIYCCQHEPALPDHPPIRWGGCCRVAGRPCTLQRKQDTWKWSGSCWPLEEQPSTRASMCGCMYHWWCMCAAMACMTEWMKGCRGCSRSCCRQGVHGFSTQTSHVLLMVLLLPPPHTCLNSA